MDRAVIYVPAGADRAKWIPRCLDHCARHGYRIVAVIDQGPWEDVRAMLHEGAVDVVVVSRFEHLPPGRLPRMEEAIDWGPPAGGGRRPRTIR